MKRILIILGILWIVLIAGEAVAYVVPAQTASGIGAGGPWLSDVNLFETGEYVYKHPGSFMRGWDGDGYRFDPFASFLWGLLSLIGSLVLSVIAVALLPRQTEVLANTVEREPLASLGIGLLATVLIPFLFVALVIIIIIGWLLIPFVALAIPVLYFYGGVGVARWLGRRIIDTTHFIADSPIAEVATGALILGLVGLIPLFGWAVQSIALLFGFGAVFLSKFGTGKPWSRGGAAYGTPQSPEMPQSSEQGPETVAKKTESSTPSEPPQAPGSGTESK